eukprot:UN32795
MDSLKVQLASASEGERESAEPDDFPAPDDTPTIHEISTQYSERMDSIHKNVEDLKAQQSVRANKQDDLITLANRMKFECNIPHNTILVEIA